MQADITQSDIPQHPGEALRDLFEQRGISQIRAAEKLGMSRGHLNSIVNGHNPISADLKLKLQDWLDVPPGFWSRLHEKREQFIDSPEGRETLRRQGMRQMIDSLAMLGRTRLLAGEIRQGVDCGWLGLEPFSTENLTRSGYWMTLGLRGLVSRYADSRNVASEQEVMLKPRLDLEPGQVLSILCQEKLTLPAGLEARVSMTGDAFSGAALDLRCRQHFMPGLETRVSLEIINRSGRPQRLSHRQQAVHLIFDFLPEEDARLLRTEHADSLR
jgi:addiction module HigA family antidote